MKRYFRLSGFFVLGLLFGGSLAFFSGTASASVRVDYVWLGLDGPYAQAVSAAGEVLGNISPYASSSTAVVASNAGGGAVNLASTSKVALGAANGAKVATAVPVALARTISPATIAKLVYKATPLGLATAVLAPVLIEAGIQYAQGQWARQSVPPSTICTSNCLSYTVMAPNGITRTANNYADAIAAINVYILPLYGEGYGATIRPDGMYQYGTMEGSRKNPVTASRDPDNYTPTFEPATQAEVESALQGAVEKSSNPAAIIQALPKDTVIPDAVAPVASGPAQVSSPTSTTTNTVNNITTTTTTQTVVNNTYNGGSVTSRVVNQTVTKDAAGNVISTTSDEPQPENVEPVVDKALPDVPKLYERKYPSGMVGVWNDGIGAIKATPIFSLPQVFAPTGINSGTCPGWSFNANIGPNMNFGTGSISPPCYVWSFIKAVVIICSLMLARALIFGG